MPKLRKLRRKKSYKVNINRKRLRDKLRKLPAIECKDIKEAWENTKSIRHNLREMGLAYDANETLKIPNIKREILSESKRMINRRSVETDSENEVKDVPPKLCVAKNLENEAKAPRERNFRLPNQQVHFLTYLMDKHGDDYKSMARDKKNHYQLTWRQIRAKINSFKGVPEQYAEYLLKKGEIVLENAESLQETKKRIAEENVAKYCAPKPKKVKKKSAWLEESVEEFYTGETLENEEKDSDDVVESSEKKLKLFSDDESEDEGSGEKGSSEKSRKTAENVQKKDNVVRNKKIEKKIDNKDKKKIELLKKVEFDDSESDEELDDDEVDEEAGFVDLKDFSDEELSDDEILDNDDFLTDSNEESD